MKRYLSLVGPVLVLAIAATAFAVPASAGERTRLAQADIASPGSQIFANPWPGGRLRSVDAVQSPGLFEPHVTCPCYYQNRMAVKVVGTGAAATMNQPAPIVGPGDTYSLAELAVGNANLTNAIEFGWMVYPGVFGDQKSHLYADYVSGNTVHCDGCGFVRNTASAKKLGDVVTPGAAVFKIQFLTNPNRWVLFYNNVSLGNFSATRWSATGGFVKVGQVQAFGEVQSSSTTKPRSQMGNGLMGTNPNAAKVTKFNVTAATNFSSWVFVSDLPTYYKIGAHSAATCKVDCSMSYGGPGSPN